ncbi:hypothetical protein KPH14_010424 [Odynerus spinipes]|uniref:Uncharacterized protein n=1 Tax=Odynerus spinipes TaxID=1348599 RepID=A0AAD9VT65_9HYME|nr:hypothetical protein KPH14_010424 [Odynerus spinipes]
MLYRTFKGSLLQNVALINLRALSTQKAKTSHKEQSINANVPGLTEKCCKVPSTSVGPSAAKDKERQDNVRQERFARPLEEVTGEKERETKH